MKIAVIGYSGAGKSTVTRALAERHGCPVLHLDQVQFLPGWIVRDHQEAVALVEAFLEKESWVIDGTYGRHAFERRMAEADQIVFLACNRFACMWQAVRRLWRYRGRTRPDMAEGCIERIDRAFVRWVLYEERTAWVRAYFQRVQTEYPDKVITLRNRRQVNAFLAEENSG